MAVEKGSRLTEVKTAKLIECLEQGGERLKDEELGLNKRYTKSL